ncbi:hypothetical protein [Streptomyces sp. NPDC006274]|uniref:hypothetical protein n=1 Tax=unclassified Streptomyces TaxID=2593676 RepID=UPI0033B80311
MRDDTGLTPRGLEARGFSGFIPFEKLPGSHVPQEGGVYVVLRPSVGPPRFLTTSPAGWRRQRDPSVPRERLALEWVDGAHVVYIGKAVTGARARHGLRGRLLQYARSGTGSSGHWGGRFVWQLEDSSSLLVAWRPTPGLDPAHVEAELIDEFVLVHGKPPFANLRRGSRSRPTPRSMENGLTPRRQTEAASAGEE